MTAPLQLAPFLRESLAIEGIHREPTDAELAATEAFLAGPLSAKAVMVLQAVYAPGKPLRNKSGMNVSVGGYRAPHGGWEIGRRLAAILTEPDPYRCHVAFELLHPFMDGNGRTGRAVWLWLMVQAGDDPFALSFLHRFYYQTLSAAR